MTPSPTESRDGAPRGSAPDQANSPAETRLNSPERYSLRVEIQRGWLWVKFVWRMMGRLGGPLDILAALWELIVLLVTRTLKQWGLLKPRSRRR